MERLTKVLSKYDRQKQILQKESSLIERVISKDYLHQYAKIPKFTGNTIGRLLYDDLPLLLRSSLFNKDTFNIARTLQQCKTLDELFDVAITLKEDFIGIYEEGKVEVLNFRIECPHEGTLISDNNMEAYWCYIEQFAGYSNYNFKQFQFPSKFPSKKFYNLYLQAIKWGINKDLFNPMRYMWYNEGFDFEVIKEYQDHEDTDIGDKSIKVTKQSFAKWCDINQKIYDTTMACKNLEEFKDLFNSPVYKKYKDHPLMEEVTRLYNCFVKFPEGLTPFIAYPSAVDAICTGYDSILGVDESLSILTTKALVHSSIYDVGSMEIPYVVFKAMAEDKTITNAFKIPFGYQTLQDYLNAIKLEVYGR